MSRRAYGQYCGLARAVELVGERWALLVVRDLLVGPRRFTDLLRGLPHIPTNILSARLRELEEAGVVRRRIQPRPAGGIVYELTANGQGLEPAVVALARWGAGSLGDPRPEEIVTVDSMIVGLRSIFDATAAGSLAAVFELRIGLVVVHARVRDGRVEVGAGSIPAPDLVIEAGPAIRELLAGERTPADALRSGVVRCIGNEELLPRFAEAFAIRSGVAVSPSARTDVTG
jgi:DNA-binding HxlR family transcriptional regulator